MLIGRSGSPGEDTGVSWQARTFSLPFLSALYLALPLFLFFGGWLVWYWALFYSAALIAALTSIWLDDRLLQANQSQKQSQRRRAVLVAALLVCATLAISGIGGWGYQESDWNKHNLILRDLIERDWPVVYDLYGRPVGLVYYFAYYLPAAVIGKLAGWQVANDALTLWSAAGLLLAIAWFHRLVDRSVWWLALLFLLFSGLDLIGWAAAIMTPEQILPPANWAQTFRTWDRWDTYVPRWQYTSHLVSLFLTPNQAIAAWSATGLFLYTALAIGTRRYIVLIGSLLMLWSPLCVIGLAPLMGIDLLYADRSWNRRIRAIFSIPNICGLLVGVILILFYATKTAPIVPPLDESFRAAFFYAEAANWRERIAWTGILVFTYLLEFGLYALIVFKTNVFDSARTKWLFSGTLILLMVIPLFVFGRYNDFGMRASIPALFFVSILLARSLVDVRRGWPRALVVVMLCLSVLNPLQQATFHLAQTINRTDWRDFRLADSRPDIVTSYAVEFQLVRQYVSNLHTPFFERFGRMDAEQTADSARSGPAYALVADSLILEYPALAKRNVAPGEQVPLVVGYRIARNPEANYSLATQLVGPDDRILWTQQAWPAGRATSTLTPGRTVYFDERIIAVPDDAPPGIYRLELYFNNGETRKRAALASLPGGEPIGDTLLVDYVAVGRPDLSPAQSFDDVNFGDELSLIGVDLPAEIAVSPGETLPISLLWQIEAQPSAAYVGFVHLVDETGLLAAQIDQPPLNGFVPTTMWRAGLTVVDRYPLQLPHSLPPGRYRLFVGLYDAQSGQRLTLAKGPASAFHFATLTVAP